MTDFKINDHILDKECESIVADAIAEIVPKGELIEDYEDELREYITQSVYGHQWIIYNYQATQLCANCNTDVGAQFLEDIGMPENPTYQSLGVIIAYGEMEYRCLIALNERMAESVNV